ncbi:MAG TPA: NADH:flavin oxidoreductase/NADH oxidase [Burkholderiales bacterium]|nr:NADH:flavin oxidoreductase/NADH oxidase [Burkholderiales bacterium]
MPANPLLFAPLQLRGVTLKNRIVISPMCQYSAKNGLANDWHLVHLGKFALGGAGLVFTEATAVEARGRITHGDLGIWSDHHVPPLQRITAFLKGHGAVPAMQLAHAGRKASMQRPWHGNGPLDDTDRRRGEDAWEVVAPSPEPMDAGWLVPHELTVAEIRQVQDAWVRAARRALVAGFEVIELHSAHGYLGHEFLSPLSNKRRDEYGGDLRGRMRFTLELAEAVRAAWPQDKPLFVRVSSVDGIDGGWSLDDTVALARELKALGVDVLDCSSGGLKGAATAARIKRSPGFQVPFSDRVRREVGMRTMTVGLILEAHQAEAILQAGQADLVAIGREALYDPNWPLHAEVALGVEGEYESWPVQYGWWLEKRRHMLGYEPKRKDAA